MWSIRKTLALAAATLPFSSAISLNLNDPTSVKNAAATIAYDMMTYYSGNQTGQTPGILPGPCQTNACYYWWEAGAMWGALINYWQWSGDTSYQPTVLQALQFQVGPDHNYNPPNQSSDMGVDDQDFWGFAAMEAAEANVPDPSSGPSWVALAQGVFNFQVQLWDTTTCGGGFHWQVFRLNTGYNLKNTISNGGFFLLAARLARYTGNQTYADWATKVYDWMEQSVLFEMQGGYLYLWDNTDANNNCTTVQNFVWTYNYGALMLGSAMMYNMTNADATWKARIDTLLSASNFLFFPASYGSNVMFEYLCDVPKNCNNDQSSFKAYLTRWMAITALLAPYTAPTIAPKLTASALGAAGQCVGGTNGRMCGRQWWTTTWDGSMGVGQQMSALAAIGATQVTADMVPKTLNTGGTSKSDPNAGEGSDPDPTAGYHKITNADRAGAAILTILIVVSLGGLCVWIML